ncbi:hypothetical protein ACAG39_09495 [Caldicellulosiruptoraceae bacterium PP1]
MGLFVRYILLKNYLMIMIKEIFKFIKTKKVIFITAILINSLIFIIIVWINIAINRIIKGVLYSITGIVIYLFKSTLMLRFLLNQLKFLEDLKSTASNMLFLFNSHLLTLKSIIIAISIGNLNISKETLF